MHAVSDKVRIRTRAEPARSDGWSAALECRFDRRGPHTVLGHYQHRGPLLFQRLFHPEEDVAHAYLLHPPGGVVGGDSLSVDMEVAPRADVLVTTPGATKFYRSGGPDAVLRQTLRISDGGCLEWFPQENIVFSGARLHATTTLHLAGSAAVIGWEILCLGRPAGDEPYTDGLCDMRLEIWRDESPLLVERQRVPGSDPLMRAPWGMAGYPVSACFFASGCGTVDLEAARDCAQPDDAMTGITLLKDVLVARCLTRSAEPAKDYFQALWRTLRPRIRNRPACAPRIWST